jgi:hypothetical protein
LILSTLDADTHKEWELHTAHHAIPWTTEFISFLETRCNALELLHNALVPGKTTAFPQPTQSAGAKVSNPSHCKLTTQVQCPVRNKCVVNAANSTILFCVSIDRIKQQMTKRSTSNNLLADAQGTSTAGLTHIGLKRASQETTFR